MIETREFQNWIGRSQTTKDVASRAPLDGLAAMLDHDMSFWRDGEVPPLAHWLYFLSPAKESEIGPDGHPKRGGFLPPITLPRRMWAGSRIEFHEIDSRRRRNHGSLRSRQHRQEAGQVWRDDLRHHSPRDFLRGCACDSRRARRGLSRRTKISTYAGRGAARYPKARMVAHHHARSSSAVPFLGPDVQRASHPLRPRLCDEDGRLSWPCRAGSADRDAADGSLPRAKIRARISRASNFARRSHCSTGCRSNSAARETTYGHARRRANARCPRKSKRVKPPRTGSAVSWGR